ncbi:MAG TPA: hypothetical protein VFS74_00285 [Gemmatimonadales bacterium]|jgi:hypothetical protein|nr:hypothetical protein [Gemmatimonadales bacterium]
MILLDRVNLLAPGWSHVVSSTHDIAELERFRIEVGAPPAALQVSNPRWPHLDLKLEPRALALAHPDAMVFETTRDLIRHMHHLRAQETP